MKRIKELIQETIMMSIVAIILLLFIYMACFISTIFQMAKEKAIIDDNIKIINEEYNI